jgi:glucokinase
MRAVLAVDVGGTGIKAEVLDEDLAPLTTRTTPTEPERGPDAVVETILRLCTEMAGDAEAVSLAVPGLVDAEQGIALWSANIGWRDVPLRKLVEQRLGISATVVHDLAVGGFAEARIGAGAGVADQLFIAIGTGIAGAITAGGHPITVGHGQAGEIGHVIVEEGGPLCGCGAHGCLEAISSAAAIARHYAARSGTQRTTAEIADRLGSDPVADEIWDNAVQALARALVSYVSLLAPSVIVVGGGLAESGAKLFEPLHAAMAARVTFQQLPALVPAKLGARATVIGAGLLAWDKLNGKETT